MPNIEAPSRAGRTDPRARPPKSRRNELQSSRLGRLDLPKFFDVIVIPIVLQLQLILDAYQVSVPPDVEFV